MHGRTEYKGTVLTSKSDYDLWKCDLDDFLYAEELMESMVPIAGDRHMPSKPDKVNSENTSTLNVYKIWQRDYYTSRLVIRSSVSEAFKKELVKMKDPKEMYDFLVAKFYVEPPKEEKEEEKEEKQDKSGEPMQGGQVPVREKKE